MASTQSTTAEATSTGMAASTLSPPGTVLGKGTLAPLATGLVLKTVWNRGTGAYHCPTGTCGHVRERLSDVLSLAVGKIPRTFTACKLCTVVVPEVTRAGTANSTTQVTGNLLDGFTVLDTVTRVQSLVTETLSSSTTSATSGGTATDLSPATATATAPTTPAVGIPRLNHSGDWELAGRLHCSGYCHSCSVSGD